MDNSASPGHITTVAVMSVRGGGGAELLFRLAGLERGRQRRVLLADGLEARRLVERDAPPAPQRRPGRRLRVAGRRRTRRRRPARELAGWRARHGAHRLSHLARQPRRSPAAAAAAGAPRPQRRRRQRCRGRQGQAAAVPARLPALVAGRWGARPQPTAAVKQRRKAPSEEAAYSSSRPSQTDLELSGAVVWAGQVVDRPPPPRTDILSSQRPW